MEGDDKPSPQICTVVAIDHTNFSYRVCSVCEKTLPDNASATAATSSSSLCKYCNFNNAFNPGPSTSKRLFRILMSIASDTKVFVVVMFDRAARVLFGCSADEFFDFAKLHPFSAETAAKVLEGEMLRVTLSKPKNGNAQHQRVVSVVPLRSGFRPAIETLRELYGVRSVS
ncbi:Translation initiation factor IF-2 like [Actinidia chinensis var. chinensis]|uniref:Translation initiation factor IF-2 like n=1 Tax=Actinidia chinensis var. chinensis TaxID=1590841 RepID=A0A2R6P7C9_ACTCC|nr:Translation initiation factor IF-2 like [Actinidia chinensis var. chinensis]